MRSPQLLVTTIVGGAMFMILFRFIFGGSIRFGTVPYVDFLIPGMVMTSVLITGTGIAVGVAEDSDQGFSDRLRSLPAPRMALLAGRALGDTSVVAWGTAVTAAIGFGCSPWPSTSPSPSCVTPYDRSPSATLPWPASATPRASGRFCRWPGQPGSR
jgi:hypothetical protein